MKFDDIAWDEQFKDWTFYDLTRLLAIVEHARTMKMETDIRRKP